MASTSPLVEMDEDVFGAPVEPLDRAARQALDEALRQGKAQIRPALLHVDETAPAQHRLQARAHRLDLGKLRHRRLRLPGSAFNPAAWMPATAAVSSLSEEDVVEQMAAAAAPRRPRATSTHLGKRLDCPNHC